MLPPMFVDPTFVAMIRELRMPGQPDPVEEILGLFRDDAREVGGMLAQAAARSDWDGVRRGAHRLKGASANVGATGLCEALTRLEAAAVDGRAEAVRAGLAGLPALVERTLAALYALA